MNDGKAHNAPQLAGVPHRPWLSAARLDGRVRRWAGWILGVGLVLVVVGYFSTPYLLGPVVSVERVTRQNIVQTVVASGQVQTPFRVAIGSQVTGVVADVPVLEGQTVKAGDLVIQVDDADAHEQVKLSIGAVDQAKARLKQLTEVAAPGAAETLKQGQVTLEDAQRTFDRVSKLKAQGFATQADYDTARKALEIGKSQVEAARILADTSRPGGMDYLLAQTQLTQVIASLRSAEAHLAYTQIRAPRDGTLITRNVERGDVVQPGKDLMDLAPAGETQIVVQVDEANLGSLRLGEPARVTTDAYPSQTFDAHVIYINPSVDAARGSIEVKLGVPDPPAYLRQDMTVSVEVEVARRNQTLVVELSAVHDLSGRQPWVMLVDKGRIRRANVKLGAIGDTAVEVLDGLQPGDHVVSGNAATLTDGQRIREAHGV